MTFRSGNTYTITVTVSNTCTTTSKSVTLTIPSYSTTKLTNPMQATILSWWKDEGIMLGCISCNSNSAGVPTCLDCDSSLTLNSGACSCGASNKYMDLTNLPTISCKNKASSSMTWALLKKSPNYQMEMSFNNGFASEISENLKTVASMINLVVQDKSGAAISIQEFTATPLDNKNLSLSFVITQDIQAGTVLTVNNNISQYNQIPFSPFMIDNYLDLAYNLPGVSYLSPETVQTITTVGTTASSAMQVQSATSGLIPILTGGISTTAVILVGFLEEIEIYKFINVPFPDNFVLFCENLEASIIPNIFSKIDENEGENPDSTYGKFAFWGVSTVLLDNSFTPITKDLGVLVVLLVSVPLAFILRGCPDISQFFLKIRDLIMWNLFLSFYLGDYTELQLNSMIQLRENTLTTTYSWLSYSLSIVIITSYAGLMVYLTVLLNWKRTSPVKQQINVTATPSAQKEEAVPKEGPKYSIAVATPIKPLSSEATLRRFTIMVEDFSQKDILTKNFMLVILLQNFLVICILFFLQDSGIAQAVLYTLLTIAFLLLILIKRPYKSAVQTGILTLNNLCKITMGIIAILLGIHEKSEYLSQSSLTDIGSVLIYMIMAAIGINSIIGLVLTIREIYEMVRKKVLLCREYRARQKAKTEKKIPLENELDRSDIAKSNNFMANDLSELQGGSSLSPERVEQSSIIDLNQSIGSTTALSPSFPFKVIFKKFRRLETRALDLDA